MIVTGILALSSKCDGSQISVSCFNILSWTTMIFSLYLILSAALSIEAQQYNNVSDRVKIYLFKFIKKTMFYLFYLTI